MNLRASGVPAITKEMFAFLWQLVDLLLHMWGLRSTDSCVETHKQALPNPQSKRNDLVQRWTTRLSINCFAFKGNGLASLLQAHPPSDFDDEDWLGQLARKSAADFVCCGYFVAVHFAFAHQERRLLETDILSKYTQILSKYTQLADIN